MVPSYFKYIAGTSIGGGTGIYKPNASIISYALVIDQKANTVAGGTATAGIRQTRNLNTIVSDVDGIVSVASNRITLQAGSYYIMARAPSWYIDNFRQWIYDYTNGVDLAQSVNSYSFRESALRGLVGCYLTISAETKIEIQQRVQTFRGTDGMGKATGFNSVEKYTYVEIYKVA